MTPEQFRLLHPRAFVMTEAEPEALARNLRDMGAMGPDERILSVGKAGAGNMNCTLRVITDRRSFIAKQSRPWVEKYPQFEAPGERACREAEFYRLVAKRPSLASRMPALLAHDPVRRVSVLEDLGHEGDYSDLYSGRALLREELGEWIRFLRELHGIRISDPGSIPLPNREMRALNHAHIFVLPFDLRGGPALDLVIPGAENHGHAIRSDRSLKVKLAELGRVYLADGPVLVHGDFFPGSIMRTRKGPKVIDPEFGFFGFPEWDGGVLLAHLFLAAQARERIAEGVREMLSDGSHDGSLLLGFVGAEILRRILGYAQLPLPGTLSHRVNLLRLGIDLVLRPDPNLVDEWCRNAEPIHSTELAGKPGGGS